MEKFLKKAKESSIVLSKISSANKSRIIAEMANALRDNSKKIIKANKIDMKEAIKNSLEPSLIGRLLLNSDRVEGMAIALEEIASQKEPIGRVLDGWITPDNLKIEKVSVAIGVIGIIYESRPNVTSDTAGLSFKSSNVCVLKGGKEAQNSTKP